MQRPARCGRATPRNARRVADRCGALPGVVAVALALAAAGDAPGALQEAGASAFLAGPDAALAGDTLEVVQTIPGAALVGGKATLVRAGLDGLALPPGAAVDGLLRVRVGGVEAASSPIGSDNGPLVPPLAPGGAGESDRLSFVFLPPAAGEVELEVELFALGPGAQRAPLATRRLGPLAFACVRRPELAYVAIDYRPFVPEPNLPDPALIAPGIGDAFLQGAYPAGDWDYRPSEPPTKLWTASLNTFFAGTALLDSMLVDLALTSPQPDFVYGWVPGGLFYNGQANGTPGRVAMGNTGPDRFQRTLAHELGHCFGRLHVQDRIGAVGADVERHLRLPLGLPRLKPASLFDLMVPGQLTDQAWVDTNSARVFRNNAALACAAARPAPSAAPCLLVAGLWERAAGRASVTETLAARGLVPDAPVPPEEADLFLRAELEDGAWRVLGVRARASAHCGAVDLDAALPVSGFVHVLPPEVDPRRVVRLAVLDRSGVERAALARSARAPELALGAPRALAAHGGARAVRVDWSAADADGDALRCALRYSPDGVRTIALATGLERPGWTLDAAALPRAGEGAWLELLASDGLRTSAARTSALDALRGAGHAPQVHVLSPDEGARVPRGATVVLHAAAWDLEDRSLDGKRVEWRSSRDGVVAAGRLAALTRLSVGTHLLTVTATDADGESASATTRLTIAERALPGGSALACQPDLGFASPGAARLEICGDALATGGRASLRVTGAPPHAPIVFLVGAQASPTPAFGGVLVPVPVEGVTVIQADAAGTIGLPGAIAGGGGPATLVVQALYAHSGVVLTNAVLVELEP